MDTATLICLSLVSVMCMAGALHPMYDDNLLQRIGMGCVGLACASFAEHVYKVKGTPFACFLLSVGLLAFAVGIAIKVYQHRPRASAEDRTEVHP